MMDGQSGGSDVIATTRKVVATIDSAAVVSVFEAPIANTNIVEDLITVGASADNVIVLTNECVRQRNSAWLTVKGLIYQVDEVLMRVVVSQLGQWSDGAPILTDVNILPFIIIVIVSFSLRRLFLVHHRFIYAEDLSTSDLKKTASITNRS